MRHSKAHRKFGRVRKVRKGLIKSLALSLVLKGKIRTTEAKAKEIRPFVEKIITLGRVDGISSRRDISSRIGVIGAEKVVKDLSPKYKGRAGGYTRITKLPQRISDGSPMAVIEFV